MLKELTMTGTIRVKVPELLKERNLNYEDLHFGARITKPTAERLSEGQAEGITFAVLANLCHFFHVGVSDILEYIPQEQSS